MLSAVTILNTGVIGKVYTSVYIHKEKPPFYKAVFLNLSARGLRHYAEAAVWRTVGCKDLCCVERSSDNTPFFSRGGDVPILSAVRLASLKLAHVELNAAMDRVVERVYEYQCGLCRGRLKRVYLAMDV